MSSAALRLELSQRNQRYAAENGLVHARRPDLIEAWYATLRFVRSADLPVRCKLLTWQELAAVLPRPLQRFLDVKYGIRAPR